MAERIGVMFTAGQDATEYASLGIHDGQMAIPGDMPIDSPILRDPQLRLHTLFGVYKGESYADIDTVRRTVGFMPRETRKEREERTLAIVNLAAELGVPGIATHIGFVPEDALEPDYVAVVGIVRRIADAAARKGITFALETGQESANALFEFLLEVNRNNVGVNFDPANMILYGSGDPIEALETVGQHVLTVHCKDGDWPSRDAPGTLGTEQPIGSGSVDFRAFLVMLRKIGYEGPLFIERETENREEQLRDIANGKAYLEAILAEA